MRKPLTLRELQRGVMLIEALIAILIFSIGILAVVGMQGIAIKNVTESRSRSEASFLASELLAQMWIDQNINGVGANTSNVTPGNYNYPGSGSIPARLGTLSPPTGWIGRVSRLPGATTVLPRVTITNATSSGATVTIQIFWQMPEEASAGLPAHNYTVVASIQV
ncbi:MAG TPA: type IV pilus modification protein PilV [Burkholderiales bacterium]|nr:type IV pilus modification protein PilV [Burkholderiales bacterium]